MFVFKVERFQTSQDFVLQALCKVLATSTSFALMIERKFNQKLNRFEYPESGFQIEGSIYQMLNQKVGWSNLIRS